MRWTKRTAGFAAVMVMGMGMAACQPSGEQPAAEQQQQQPAAQAPAAQPAAPAELPAGVTQEMYAQGQALFTGQGICYTCHGMNAEGSQLAPNLRDNEWLWVDPAQGNLQQQIAQIIRTGVPQPKQYPAPMPPMAGVQLSDDQIQALSAYVASIAGTQ